MTFWFNILAHTVDRFSGILKVIAGCLRLSPFHQSFPAWKLGLTCLQFKPLYRVLMRSKFCLRLNPTPLSAAFRFNNFIFDVLWNSWGPAVNRWDFHVEPTRQSTTKRALGNMICFAACLIYSLFFTARLAFSRSW